MVIDFEDQQNAFWRELAEHPPLPKTQAAKDAFMAKWIAFMDGLQAQISHLPQDEQNAAMLPVISRNAIYIDLLKHDRAALKARLGIPTPPAFVDHLGQVAVETAVRATIWECIRKLFFR